MTQPQRWPFALARTSDPSTSHAAAESATGLAERHRNLVLEAAKRLRRPAGAEEIAVECGLAAYQVRKRLPELSPLHMEPLEDRQRKTSTGRWERLWRVVGQSH